MPHPGVAQTPQVLAKTALEPFHLSRTGSKLRLKPTGRRWPTGDESQAKVARVVSPTWYNKDYGIGTQSEQLFLALVRLHGAESVPDVNEWAKNVASSGKAAPWGPTTAGRPSSAGW